MVKRFGPLVTVVKLVAMSWSVLEGTANVNQGAFVLHTSRFAIKANALPLNSVQLTKFNPNVAPQDSLSEIV